MSAWVYVGGFPTSRPIFLSERRTASRCIYVNLADQAAKVADVQFLNNLYRSLVLGLPGAQGRSITPGAFEAHRNTSSTANPGFPACTTAANPGFPPWIWVCSLGSSSGNRVAKPRRTAIRRLYGGDAYKLRDFPHKFAEIFPLPAHPKSPLPQPLGVSHTRSTTGGLRHRLVRDVLYSLLTPTKSKHALFEI
jgi:hypothetical protein